MAQKTSAEDATKLATAWYHLMGREPDADGLQHWVHEIQADGSNTAWKNFSTSPEPSRAGVVQRAAQMGWNPIELRKGAGQLPGTAHSFLGDIADAHGQFTRSVLTGLKDNPSMLLHGMDPLSTKVGNALTGRHDTPIVGQFGGPNPDTLAKMNGGGRSFFNTADSVAQAAAAKGVSPLVGRVVGAANGAVNSVLPSWGSGVVSPLLKAGAGAAGLTKYFQGGKEVAGPSPQEAPPPDDKYGGEPPPDPLDPNYGAPDPQDTTGGYYDENGDWHDGSEGTNAAPGTPSTPGTYDPNDPNGKSPTAPKAPKGPGQPNGPTGGNTSPLTLPLSILQGLNAANLSKQSTDYAKQALATSQNWWDARKPLRDAGLAGMTTGNSLPDISGIDNIRKTGNPFANPVSS